PAARTSCSSMTGTPRSAASKSRSGTSRQPMFAAYSAVPVSTSTEPGTTTPPATTSGPVGHRCGALDPPQHEAGGVEYGRLDTSAADVDGYYAKLWCGIHSEPPR